MSYLLKSLEEAENKKKAKAIYDAIQEVGSAIEKTQAKTIYRNLNFQPVAGGGGGRRMQVAANSTGLPGTEPTAKKKVVAAKFIQKPEETELDGEDENLPNESPYDPDKSADDYSYQDFEKLTEEELAKVFRRGADVISFADKIELKIEKAEDKPHQIKLFQEAIVERNKNSKEA